MTSGIVGYCLMLMTYTITAHMLSGMLWRLLIAAAGSGSGGIKRPRILHATAGDSRTRTGAAHKLKIEAVHNRTSSDIQISHKTQPSCHEPAKINFLQISKETSKRSIDNRSSQGTAMAAVALTSGERKDD
uniref:Uncharacterized protein n=1 Tax=Glossina austeni TaxID=7395 RepID=A0A1A9VT15_GLOAU